MINSLNAALDLPVALLERKLISSPTSRIYVPVADQAVYNFILKPLGKDLDFMKSYCTQYIEHVTQAELRSRMSDGVIRNDSGLKYTVNWISSAALSLQANELMLYFRTPHKNVALHPRVLVSVVKPEYEYLPITALNIAED